MNQPPAVPVREPTPASRAHLLRGRPGADLPEAVELRPFEDERPQTLSIPNSGGTP